MPGLSPGQPDGRWSVVREEDGTIVAFVHSSSGLDGHNL